MRADHVLTALRAGDPQLDLMLDAIAAGLVTLGRPNRDALDLVTRYFARWSEGDLELVFLEDPWAWAGKLHFWQLEDPLGYSAWRRTELEHPPPELEVLRLRVRHF
ncbi:MAG: hypothetical protein KC766_07975 [Myxococcales bacterium]|nr:hypothetical protein [Myxococcales bacterium]